MLSIHYLQLWPCTELCVCVCVCVCSDARNSSVFFPPSDIQSLLEVRAKLKEAISFWLDLGLALGLHQHTLESIKLQNLKDIGQCLMETLAAWLQGRDGVATPTWRAVVEALLSPAIKFH